MELTERTTERPIQKERETKSEREEIFVEVYTKSDWYEQSTSTV